MHRLVACILLAWSATSSAADPKPGIEARYASEQAPQVQLSDSQFYAKLETMMSRINKTISLNRQQISDNPGAPFLPDLYLQLAELLSQRADIMYYIEVERAKKRGTDLSTAANAETVTRAGREAIQVLERINTDFPNFSKRPRVLLLLAAGYRSINEIPRFKTIVDRLTDTFGSTVEAAKARLLMGEKYFEIKGYDEAMGALRPVLNSKFPYERNAARFRTAVCLINLERFKESLPFIEQIVHDPDLEIDSSAGQGDAVPRFQEKVNLKREALLDSIRAFTHLYPKGGDALSYYSGLSPNELYFQEVIEKLAFRYISINQAQVGIRLLRSMSERIRDPSKVVRIYLDVLQKLPDQDRYSIPPAELEFVVQNLISWLAFYQIEPGFRSQAETFFEKQVRDLGTTAHDKAKAFKTPTARMPAKEEEVLLDRAEQYYRIHLAYFPSSKVRGKIAANLGDVLYLKRDYAGCGETYLRSFLGQNGKPEEPDKLIQNSILCLQTVKPVGFFDGVRARGLLIKALRSYITWKPKLNESPRIQFALLKAYYDQGFYDDAIPKFYSFMKKFRTSPFAANAGDLLLDYYATRNDLPGLAAAANQILTIQPGTPAFLARVQDIKRQAAMKKLNERLDAVVSRGDSSSSAFYLQEAMKSRDVAVQDAAFQQALASAKREGDVDVFMKAASVLLSHEASPERQAELTQGMAIENVKVTRYYHALEVYEKLLAQAQTPASVKFKVFEQAVDLALPLRDPEALSRLLARPEAAKMSTEMKARAGSLYAAVLDAGKSLPEPVLRRVIQSVPSEEARVAFFKAQSSLPAALKSKIQTDAQMACLEGDSRGLFCVWQTLVGLDASHARWLAEIKAAKPALETLEKYAKGLEGLVSEYAAVEGTNDAHIDTIRLIRLQTLFKAFAAHLAKLANQSPELKQVLLQKAGETESNARKSQESCLTLAKQAQLRNPASPYCSKPESAPGTLSLLRFRSKGTYTVKSQDPQTADIVKLERKIFSTAQDGPTLVELAETYYSNGYPNHAMAASLLGTASFPDKEADFAAIAGCAASTLGLTKEAAFHLKKASDYHGLKSKCGGG